MWDRLFRFSKSAPGPSWLEPMEEKNRPSNYLEYLSLHSPQLMKKYGGIIRLAKKRYLIADPEAFKYILKTNVSNFTKRNMTYRRLALIFGNGLIVNEGPIWEQHRTLLQPVFDRKRLLQYATQITACTQEILKKWQQSSSQSQSINIAKEMGTLTLNIAFKVFSSYSASPSEIETVIRLFERGNPHVSFFPFLKPWVPTPKNLLFFSSLRQLNALLQNIIEQKKNHASRRFDSLDGLQTRTVPDALDVLLNAQKTHNITLNANALLDEYKTLLITGHETTGCGLAWAYTLLARYPEYQVRMEEELKSVLQGRIPTLEDCSKLPFTRAVFLETLRLYPSIWCLPRVSLQPDVVCGFDIPADSQVILNLYALHRNPEHWENPDVFYPPRFLGDSDTKRHLFSYLPFSIGPHACIGTHFGVMEGILVLATIGQHCRLNLTKKNKSNRCSNKLYIPKPYVSLRLPANTHMCVEWGL